MIARQPFTFGGVARFSQASFARLAAVALIFGVVSGIVVSWITATCLAPVLDEAVSKLPATGSIEQGMLRWPEPTGRLLAANAFTSMSIVIQESESVGAPVDFAFEFRTNELVMRSLLGARVLPYPARTEIELNRTAFFPTWGAWRAPIIFGLVPGTAIALFLFWSLLAIVYAVIPLFIAGLFGRDLDKRGAWKLAVAAQLPGSLMMAFALALYSTGKVAVILVLVMLPAHLLLTFIYLFISPFLVPKAEISDEKNPFDSEGKRKRKGKNPFAGK
ncbi:MAG: hypothetical protein ACXW3L_01510 [Limisphaerales bacterium]